MRLLKLKSSHLAAAGYDRPSETLTIQFQNGSTYEYKDVPVRTFNALMTAKSHGEFFSSRIKPNFKRLKR